MSWRRRTRRTSECMDGKLEWKYPGILCGRVECAIYCILKPRVHFSDSERAGEQLIPQRSSERGLLLDRKGCPL
jgi:hypothetical protein